jgi:LEA14-like dessication related protein
MSKIKVKNTEVEVILVNDSDYISLTDIAKYKTDDTSAVIGNWMRNRNTIEFLGIWETLYNPNFKPLEFEGFKKEVQMKLMY